MGYNLPMIGNDANELPPADPLTRREGEILNCIGDGMSNRQIADHLTIAMSTVKWYVRQIYSKLSVSSREEAIVRAQNLGLLAAEQSKSSVRHNLPQAAAIPFVGRERELAALGKLIADPQLRIITILGPGGIGKSRLALEAAGAELLSGDLFSDGIFFVSLAPLESADEIAVTTAATLDFQFEEVEEGSRSETEQLLNFLGQKKILLVMDNFEHILDGRDLLTQISAHASQIKLLVTSRERLQLRGEQLFPLQGLEMPKTGDSSEEGASSYAAAQLFMNIAIRSTPEFTLSEGDSEHLAYICRLVEGMPLGLELAASWAGILPLSAIALEINQSLQLLISEDHNVPPRHRSMKAALEASWKRLSSEQKLGFQQLTIFRGGFTRTAALEVAGAALPLLVTLVNKSWLSYDRGKDRYTIHELLRQYGSDKLRSGPGDEHGARDRHSAYFCGTLKAREVDWYGAKQKEVAVDMQQDIENLQTAWRRAASHGNVNLLGQGLNCLCRYYLWEGRMNEGQNACRAAEEGLTKFRPEMEINDLDRLALRSQVLAWESEFSNFSVQKEELLQQSQRLLERVTISGRDTRAEQAFIYLEKALSAGSRDIDEVIRFASLGMDTYRTLNDPWGEAKMGEILGGYYVFRGRFKTANELLRSSLELYRSLGDLQGIAQSMIYLGFSARYRGKFKEAEMHHREGLELFQKLGNRRRERISLGVLSFSLSWAGKFSEAKEFAEQAIEVDRDLGRPADPAALNTLANALIHFGLFAEAKDLEIGNLEVARRGGDLPKKAHATMFLGEIALVEGDLAGAKRYLLESADLFTEIKHNYAALPMATLSYVVRAQGDGKLASEVLMEALRSGIERQSISPIIYCMPIAALVAADKGHLERALELNGLAQQYAHISQSRWFEAIAGRELNRAFAAVPVETAAAAENKGRGLDLWSTAEDIIRELGQS